MAGRREVPVDPGAGPVQRFAFDLRKLRTEAGGLTHRAMAARAGYSITTLSQAAAGEQLPTLPVALAFAAACGGDPAEWEARWHQAVEEAAALDEQDGGEGAEPPYRGLARFETDDSGLFFGRERLTGELVDLMRRRRFAAVFGPSGIGMMFRQVESMAFSPDGRTLASVAGGGTVRLWDTATRYERATLDGGGEGSGVLAFSPDGRTLATGDYDGRLRLWDAALPGPEKAVTGICRAVHRDLTQQERAQYLPDEESGRVC